MLANKNRRKREKKVFAKERRKPWGAWQELFFFSILIPLVFSKERERARHEKKEKTMQNERSVEDEMRIKF